MKLPTAKALLQKLLLALTASLVLLAVLEITARLFLPRSGIAPPAIPAAIGRFDPDLGWSLEPGSHASSTATGYRIEYRINSRGLRDSETTYEKPDGLFRIVLIGDSSTFGFGVPVEKDFATILEGYYREVEVINMGVSGFGVDQELLFLEREGFRYRPDLVIALVEHYGSQRHLFTVRFNKRKPRFVLDENGELVLTNSPVDETPVVSRSFVARTAGATSDWLIVHSQAYRVLLGMLAGLRPKRKNKEALSPLDIEKLRKEYKPEWSANELHELGEAIVQRMHDVSVQHGAKFLLVTRMRKLLLAARQRHIMALDVREAMSNPAFTIPHLLHFNESGHGVMAREIARFLDQAGLIPEKRPESARKK